MKRRKPLPLWGRLGAYPDHGPAGRHRLWTTTLEFRLRSSQLGERSLKGAGWCDTRGSPMNWGKKAENPSPRKCREHFSPEGSGTRGTSSPSTSPKGGNGEGFLVGSLDRQRTRRCGEVGKRRWRHSGEEPGCTGSWDAEVADVEVVEMHLDSAC